MNKDQLIQFARRKINARQHSRINEGKLRVQTPNGFILVEDGDWIVSGDVKDQNFIIPKHTMEFLSSTAVEAPAPSKPSKKEAAPKEEAAAASAPVIMAVAPAGDLNPAGSADIQDHPSDHVAAAPVEGSGKKKKAKANGSASPAAPKKRGRKPKAASGTVNS